MSAVFIGLFFISAEKIGTLIHACGVSFVIRKKHWTLRTVHVIITPETAFRGKNERNQRGTVRHGARALCFLSKRCVQIDDVKGRVTEYGDLQLFGQRVLSPNHREELHSRRSAL